MDSVMPQITINVLDADFQYLQCVANALVRKLRDWKIGVDAVLIPKRSEGDRPVLRLVVNPACSIKPLLDATQGHRHWLPATGRLPARMYAFLDGCELMWELPAHRRFRSSCRYVRAAVPIRYNRQVLGAT